MSKLTPALSLFLACGLPALAQDKPAAKPAPAPAAAPAALTVGQVFDRSLGNIEKQVVTAAEAMPEDKFDFAPTAGEFKGVKTYAQQVKHLAAVNYLVGSTILGEKAPVELDKAEMGPDNIKTKADIVAYLKDSYVYAHKALVSVTAQNEVTPVKSPFGSGTVTRLGMATLIAAHNMDHYGQMVVYLRMNGIIPPASRR